MFKTKTNMYLIIKDAEPEVCSRRYIKEHNRGPLIVSNTQQFYRPNVHINVLDELGGIMKNKSVMKLEKQQQRFHRSTCNLLQASLPFTLYSKTRRK